MWRIVEHFLLHFLEEESLARGLRHIEKDICCDERITFARIQFLVWLPPFGRNAHIMNTDMILREFRQTCFQCSRDCRLIIGRHCVVDQTHRFVEEDAGRFTCCGVKYLAAEWIRCTARDACNFKRL
jgi:hypothetical protein